METNKIIKNKSANNYMWVSFWLDKVDPENEDTHFITAYRYNGKWKCDIDLPLINKIVESISTTEVNAMKNASDRAAKLIDKYMESHPKLKIRNHYKGNHYVFTEKEDGTLDTVGMDDTYQDRLDERIAYIMDESLKAVQKAIKRIERINGTTVGLFIHVFDKASFGKNKSDKEINLQLFGILNKLHGENIIGVNHAIVGESVISIGYAYSE